MARMVASCGGTHSAQRAHDTTTLLVLLELAAGNSSSASAVLGCHAPDTVRVGFAAGSMTSAVRASEKHGYCRLRQHHGNGTGPT